MCVFLLALIVDVDTLSPRWRVEIACGLHPVNPDVAGEIRRRQEVSDVQEKYCHSNELVPERFEIVLEAFQCIKECIPSDVPQNR